MVVRARRLERVLTQPLFTTEQFTGLKGKLVSLADALDGCERILRDEFKDYPESALYMVGTIDEAKAKAKPVPPAAAAKPESTAAKLGLKDAAGLRGKAASGPQPNAGAKPQSKSPTCGGSINLKVLLPFQFSPKKTACRASSPKRAKVHLDSCLTDSIVWRR